MQVFAHDGEVGFEGIWTAITAARGFSPLLLKPPKDATHWVRYTTGGTAALGLNQTLTGNTSGKKCTLVAQIVEQGTAGSGDSGILFVQGADGAFQAETVTSASTGTVAILQDFLPILTYSPPKAALISIETAAIKFSLSGILPTATSGANYIHHMDAGQSYVIRGYNNIRKFNCINAVASNGAIVKYSLFF